MTLKTKWIKERKTQKHINMNTEKKRRHVSIDFQKPILVNIYGINLVVLKMSFGINDIVLYESISEEKIRINNAGGFVCEINKKDILAINEAGKQIWNKKSREIRY